MRIFYASHHAPHFGLASSLWLKNLYQSLVDMGADVVMFDYDLMPLTRHAETTDESCRAFIAEHRPHASQALYDQIKAAHARKPIDLFFSYFYDACVLPETIDAIRDLGILTANFYCNASYQLHLVSEISPRYDWCLVPEAFRLEDYRQLGAHPLYFQMAANPSAYRCSRFAGYRYDLSFVGQAYGERPLIIQFLTDHALPPRVWGLYWHLYQRPAWYRHVRHLAKHFWPQHAEMLRAGKAPRFVPFGLAPAQVGEPLDDSDLANTFRHSKINLGFSICGHTHTGAQPIRQVRLRDFEVPMSGGFYLAPALPELRQFLEPDKEVVFYESPDELLDKARFYLAHDGAREQIRQAGHRRCLAEHTWQHRFRHAFDAMGLSAQAKTLVPLGES